jgi:hypothetical protein
VQLPFTSPVEAVQCFAKAVATRDESAAKVASTKEGFTFGPAEGPGAYFHRLVTSGVELKVLEPMVKQRDDVAVVPVAAVKAGSEPAPLFFFLQNAIGSWRITGVTRSPAYAKKVFEGSAPALLDITQLPPEPEVMRWTEGIVAPYEGDATAAADVPGIDDLVRRWRAFVAAPEGSTFVKRTLKVPWFDRAAVQFAHELPGREEAMWMVVARKGEGWEPVWFGHDFEPSTLFIRLP